MIVIVIVIVGFAVWYAIGRNKLKNSGINKGGGYKNPSNKEDRKKE